MTSLTLDWLSPTVTQHVALALLHFLWQGALVAVAVALVLRLLRDDLASDEEAAAESTMPASVSSRANARYLVACFALLLMAVLPVVNLLIVQPDVNTPGSLDTVGTAGHMQNDSRAEDSLHAASTDARKMSFDASGGYDAETANTVEFSGGARLAMEEDPQSATASSSWSRFLLQIFFWIWVAGVVLLAAWHLVAWVLSQRLRYRGVDARSEVLGVVSKVARRMGIRRAVKVRQTMEAAAPMVIGWIKPVLVLPMSVLTGLSPAELAAVLAHELAHIRRHDYLVNLVQAVVETVLFYHPAVWWLSRQIRCEREFCADDLAMRVCEGRDVYARSLVALAEIARTPHAYAMAATGGRLVVRIRRVMLLPDGQPEPRWAAGRTSLVAVAAVMCLGGVMAVAQNRADNAQQPKAPPGIADREKARDPFALDEDEVARDANSGNTGGQVIPADSSNSRPRGLMTPGSWEHIEAALKEHCEFEFIETPLQTVIEYLTSTHGVNLVLDMRALDKVGIGRDLPISLTVSGVSLAQVLDHLAKSYNLTWCVKHNAVLITPRMAGIQFDVRVYRDHAPQMIGAGMGRDIMSEVSSDSWDVVGGWGSLVPVSSNLLVIRQSHEVHQQIEERYADELQVVPPAWAALPPGLADTPMGKELNRVSSLEFTKTPLKDVIAHLSKKHHVAIRLNEAALNDLGLRGDVPITRNLAGIPLRSILSLFLEDLGLVWMADKNEIRITTPEVAEAKLVRFQYPVDDLKVAGRTWPLIPLIESTIGDNWVHFGGPATIQQDGGNLDIRQTFDRHLQISALLETLRRANRNAQALPEATEG